MGDTERNAIKRKKTPIKGFHYKKRFTQKRNHTYQRICSSILENADVFKTAVKKMTSFRDSFLTNFGLFANKVSDFSGCS